MLQRKIHMRHESDNDSGSKQNQTHHTWHCTVDWQTLNQPLSGVSIRAADWPGFAFEDVGGVQLLLNLHLDLVQHALSRVKTLLVLFVQRQVQQQLTTGHTHTAIQSHTYSHTHTPIVSHCHTNLRNSPRTAHALINDKQRNPTLHTFLIITKYQCIHYVNYYNLQ